MSAESETREPLITPEADHKHLSAECFNAAWGLLGKSSRTPEEDALMLSLSLQSLEHWKQRPDCTPQNLSIGYWQISRIQAVLGRAEEARHFGDLCLEASQNGPPFYLGYAHEALARAAKVRGNTTAFQHHLDQARSLCAQVAEAEERKWLSDDLDELGAPASGL